MLVVGGKEEENEAVSVRSRFKGDEGQMKLDDFLAAIKEEIANRENRKVEKEDLLSNEKEAPHLWNASFLYIISVLIIHQVS